MSRLRTANSLLRKGARARLTRTAPPSPAPARDPAAPGPVAASARPPADPATDRLLRAPVFILSAPRSGSTLLRVILNSHSRLCAPHETHVRMLHVRQSTPTVTAAMDSFGHNTADIEHLLWDRVLHRELVRSGKPTLVEKTPSNVFVSERLATCWPDARFVFLLRHPASVARSWHEGDPAGRPMERAVPHVLAYMEQLERTRQQLPGHTVRYESLTADPEGETRKVCAFLDIPWEESMTAYGDNDHGEFVKGLGDWKDKIRTGTVQRSRPLPTPEEIPAALLPMCRTWGYLD
ncbi:sulfotransferase family protein [Streptomyces sp. CA2R106]|uniref:sulfotransferase family protein n=1 Tax=Streptomyces sp. CA2R106 TaxID=3120153 RepID=UPI003007FC5F